MSSDDDCFSPILTTRRVTKPSLSQVSTPIQPKRSIASKLSLTKQRNARQLLENQENVDPFRTPDTVKRVSASFLFSSCKKKPVEEAQFLPGHSILVDDSSDEELVKCDLFKDEDHDQASEIVDDSLVEYSLIRKWLQNAEDSFETDDKEDSNPKDDSNDSSSSDHLEIIDTIKYPEVNSIKKEDTIILSSENEESPVKPVYQVQKNATRDNPKLNNQISLKSEPDLSDSFDSLEDSNSLQEKLAKSIRSNVGNQIVNSSTENLFPKHSRRHSNDVLCISTDDEESSSPQALKNRPKIVPGKDIPSMPVCIPESDSELEDIFVTLTIDEPPAVKPKKITKPRQKKKIQQSVIADYQFNSKSPRSFLASLSSDIPAEYRHQEAVPYMKNFRKCRDELTHRLFILFNEKVFKNFLPRDFSITWNSRLTRTAGYCRHFTKRENGMTGYESRIELSVKVVDTPCRLRDTLVHELCHAATWVIDNCRGGHGPVWRKWANQALDVFPELPPITRCHNYEISYKFYYNCANCKYSAGRHSKSIDTNTHVCPMCRGKLQLSKEPPTNVGSNEESTSKATKTPRTPNAFALFVKENYAVVKASRSDLPHAAVMKVLSAKFAESKTKLV